ncbi:MAG: 2-oxoglutarate synthase [Pseudomonadota bacterium]
MQRLINQPLATSFLAGTLLFCSSLTLADDDFFGTGFNKSFNFRLSGFWAKTSTKIRVDSNDGVIGEEISFEDDLNLSERKTLPLFDITYRFNPRHMLDFSYVDLERTASSTWTKEGTTTDDIRWSVGTEIRGGFESEVYRLAYGYSFINDGKKELGVLLGLHTTRIGITIEGEGELVIVDGEGNEVVVDDQASRTYDEGFTIPLPMLGLTGSYAFTPKLYMRGWVQFFTLDYDEYDGSLLNASGMLAYDLTNNFGIGAGYAYYSYDLDVERDNLKGSFTYDFQGPTAFLYASF